MMLHFRTEKDGGSLWLLQEYRSAWGLGWKRVKLLRTPSIHLPWPTAEQLAAHAEVKMSVVNS